jgi:hemolysin III
MGIAADIVDLPTFSTTLLYSVCLLTMLGCSAAYNLASNASQREFLRQLDHAAIFLMIAGTYIPFTTCRLHGVWAIGMTTAVWTGALTGAVIKLICPSRIERVSVVAYLGLGWIILAGTRPMLGSVDLWTPVLIGVGGVLYSIGGWFSPLADAALPEGNMAQPRAGGSELPLRSRSAWCGVGPIMKATSLRSQNATWLIAMSG